MLIDYKVEMWIRIELHDCITESDVNSIITDPDKSDCEKLDELCELDQFNCEDLLETSVWLPIEENDGQPTIEVLKDPENKIWDNVNGFNLSEDTSMYNQ